jgi:hypothetical protein
MRKLIQDLDLMIKITKALKKTKEKLIFMIEEL